MADEEEPLSSDITMAIPSIPDVAEPLLGFRSWVWDRKRHMLHSVVSTGHYWPPGKDMLATCGRKHPAAAEGCSCGVYAAYDIAYAAPYTGVGNVFGLVWGFGEFVVPAENGFRAQYGRIAAFFSIVREVSMEPLQLRRIAKQYGVPLITPHSVVVEDYRLLITHGGGDLDGELERLLRGEEGQP